MSGYPRYILVTFISTDMIFFKSIFVAFWIKFTTFKKSFTDCDLHDHHDLNIRGEFKEWVGRGGGDGWLLKVSMK